MSRTAHAPVRLGVNIDHVATLRNQRDGSRPDVMRAAKAVADAGADGVTVHLREDRRHIRDADVRALCDNDILPVNLEMAATEEMRAIALLNAPHAVCLVPEKREERTTEGGLDVVANAKALRDFIAPLVETGSRVSLFIEADAACVTAAADIGAAVVELHTGTYADLHLAGDQEGAEAAFAALAEAATLAADAGLEVHMGHGLDFETAARCAALPEVAELNIGHFLIGEAVFVGLPAAVERMREAMARARAAADAA